LRVIWRLIIFRRLTTCPSTGPLLPGPFSGEGPALAGLRFVSFNGGYLIQSPEPFRFVNCVASTISRARPRMREDAHAREELHIRVHAGGPTFTLLSRSSRKLET
jgi:hypothetical protein